MRGETGLGALFWGAGWLVVVCLVTAAGFGKRPMGLVNRFVRIKGMTPSFRLMGASLSSFSLGSLGKGGIVLGVFPDLSADIYTASMHGFGGVTTNLGSAVMLTVSGSLPFTRTHFYAARNVRGMVPLSSFHCSSFSRDCNMHVTSNPLTNLLTHSIIIVNGSNGVTCARLMPRIARRPSCSGTLTTIGRWVVGRERPIPFGNANVGSFSLVKANL